MKTRMQPVALFIFAHQDDEVGIFRNILNEIGDRRVICLYLTDGAARGDESPRRNRESLGVLRRLGVPAENVFFAGDDLGVRDGQLLNHLDAVGDWLEEFMTAQQPICSIYLPAWEGGHHDHDATHALGVLIAHKLGLLNVTRQFPLYNGYGCGGPLFRVFLPLPDNGAATNITLRWDERTRFLRYCLLYPSQFITWVGLLPFVFLHYVFWGTQVTQPVSVARISERPHDGALYYERRKFCTYTILAGKVSSLAQRYLKAIPGA